MGSWRLDVDTAAAFLTVKLALSTALILLVLGLPLAWWLAVTTSRARVVVETVVALPLVLPPTVLGFYVLTALGPDGVVGQPLASWFDLRLPFTFAGLLVGSVLFNLPFAVRPFASAIAAVDRSLLEAAACLGSSTLRTFFRVVLPLAAPGIRAGVVLTIAHAIGELGVVLMVGGNIEGATRTLSLTIYDDVQALDYQSAHHTALLLLAVAFVALALTSGARRRGGLL